MSDPEARHSRNIAARPQVAIVIFDSHEAGGWKAVYVSATAGEVTGADVERGIEALNVSLEKLSILKGALGDAGRTYRRFRSAVPRK